MAISDASRLADFATGVGTDGTLVVNNINASGIVTSTGNAFVGSAISMYASSGIVSATEYYGSGANLTDVISGVELKSDGNSVGTAITQINFSGFGSVTAPVSGFSTVTINRLLTVGVRSGAAITMAISGSSLIVEARGGGDVDIDL